MYNSINQGYIPSSTPMYERGGELGYRRWCKCVDMMED